MIKLCYKILNDEMTKLLLAEKISLRIQQNYKTAISTIIERLRIELGRCASNKKFSIFLSVIKAGVKIFSIKKKQKQYFSFCSDNVFSKQPNGSKTLPQILFERN